jgi:hypothetical protein
VIKFDRSKWPAPLRWLTSRWGVLLVILGVWATLASQVGGSEFILEEAQQQTVFSAWFAQDAGRYDLILQAADMAEQIQRRGQRINKYFGWINPFARAAYGPYFNMASPLIIQSMRAMALQQNGQAVTADIRHETWEDPERLFGRGALSDTINYADAKLHIGELVTILIPVIDARKRDTIAYANSDQDFSLVTFPKHQEAYDYFPELGGKWVIARGTVVKYQKKDQPLKYEIVVEDISQILAIQPLNEGG